MLTKKQSDDFRAGYYAGAIWGITSGLERTCAVIGGTTGAWGGFPPELVQAFAAMMRGCIPQIAQSLASGLQDMDQRRVNEEGAVQ